MLYEAHVTVEGEDVEPWQNFCQQRNIKPVFIKLSRGEFPTQLMCTAAHDGDEVSADDMVGQLMFDAKRAGFKCLRAKLERPFHSGLVSDPDAAYAECHIKFLLPESEAHRAMALEDEQIFVSESLLGNHRPLRKWYLTARTNTDDLTIAEDYFWQIEDRLCSVDGFVKMETEVVVYDTNPDLDKGWAHT